MLWEYVPSVHFAEAPVGSVLLALVVDEFEVVAAAGVVAGLAGGGGAVGAVDAPAAVPTPPWCEQAPLPIVVLVVPSLQVTVVPLDADLDVAAGAAGAVVVAAAFGAVVELVGVPTPPWCEQAPLPVVVLVVPSLHVTVVPVVAVLVAGDVAVVLPVVLPAEVVAVLSTPP